MLLKSIVIQGFKSFADKTVFNFGEGITAVVGPNGSGKSNISDAVRWVLGEQSTKTLRGLKMEDVVFGGTATRKPLGYAEVTLTIDNSDRRIPCDSDEVAVTRRYYRSGDSEYRINNAGVRLKDVHELFMDTGLGRDGYSMVGQGRIDDIVGTKTSAERRDIFEEAAGISRYRYRKTEAERKLAAAEDNLVRLRDILAELENRVGPLAEQSKKAERFLEYSKEQEHLQIGLWLNSIAKYKDQLREQEYKITAARAQYDAASEQTQEIESKIERLSDESQQLIIKMDDTRRSAAEMEERAARIDGDIAVENNTIFHNGETVARIEAELKLLQSSDSRIDDEIALKQGEIEAAGKVISQLELSLSEVNAELLSLVSESDGFSQRIDELNSLLNRLSAEMADERVSMSTSQSTVTEIEARRGTIESQIDEKRKAVEALDDEMSALERDLKHCDETAAECENAIKGRRLIRDKRAAKCDEIKQQIDALVLESNDKLHRAQILEDLEKNMEGFNYSVKAVMSGHSSGILRGIHGPVSRIISVPQKYSAAIEAALGAALQNIVVGNEEDAKRAINHLKQTKGGRATFLPMTAIRPRNLQESGLDDCLGFEGIAAGLVECDAKYSDIVSSLLGNVAVVDDIDSAVAMAKKYRYHFKIVTLDGQIVNAGGSMTGGSMGKNAGLLSRANDIQKLRKEAADLEAKAEAVKADYKRLSDELATIDAQLLTANSELTTANEDKIRVLGEIKRVGDLRVAAVADLAANEQERDSSAERIKLLIGTAAAAERRIAELSEQITVAESEMSVLTGGRDASSGRRDELGERIAQIRTEIFENNKSIELMTESINSLNARRSDSTGRADTLTAEMVQINSQVEQIKLRIEQLTAEAVRLRSDAAEQNALISGYSQRRDQLEHEIIELRRGTRDKLEEKERLSGEVVRLEERKVAMVRDYDDIIRKLYDEYGLTRSEAEDMNIVIDDIAAATKRVNELKGKIRALGNVNVAAIEEYKEVSERYEFMSAQIADIERSRAELITLIGQLTEQMKALFIERFEQINRNFSEVFVELFGGGTAELKLSDPDDVLQSGIEIIVQPPGKNISIIEQLSGGEKALIAISIYFAVMKVAPPPFCVLDEVDAALDDVNITRFADYLRRMSKSTQFIIITHRRGSMEEADVLYGVTMQEKGVSKLLELNVADMERQLDLKHN